MNHQGLVSTIEIRNRNGRVVGTKEVVKYPGLLGRAHEASLKRIETQIVQIPTEGNGMMAVVHATVETEKGLFTGAGEATPENTNSRVGRYLISMAETRAKARALRDAVNIGVVSLEEILGETTDNGFLRSGEGENDPRRGHAGPFPSHESGQSSRQADGTPMSEAQRRYLYRLLAEQGIRGDGAHSFLKEHFGTELQAVKRDQASSLIEELLGGVKT